LAKPDASFVGLYGHDLEQKCCRKYGSDYAINIDLEKVMRTKEHTSFCRVFRQLRLSSLANCSAHILSVNKKSPHSRIAVYTARGSEHSMIISSDRI